MNPPHESDHVTKWSDETGPVAQAIRDLLKKAGGNGILLDDAVRALPFTRDDIVYVLILLDGMHIVKFENGIIALPSKVIDVPFKDVQQGEKFRTSHSKRFVVAVKTKPIQVADVMNAGRELPFRNAVIIEVFDLGIDSLGVHIFEEDDLVVTVDRRPPSGWLS